MKVSQLFGNALFVALGATMAVCGTRGSDPGVDDGVKMTSTSPLPTWRVVARAEHGAQVARPPSLPVETVTARDDEQATRVVTEATLRGVWTETDREALRIQFETLDGDAKADIAALVADAINRGELRIETDVPL